jgi:SAM-dependent methyltransferase
MALAESNRRFYDGLWSRTALTDHRAFNTWPVLEPLLAAATDRIEIGPGMRPRLPVPGTRFVDLSPVAVASLRADGGIAVEASITCLPLPPGCADLVCAMDVIEHVEDDRQAVAELHRVLRPGGVLVTSLPLGRRRFDAFDKLVGHARRYEPDEVLRLLVRGGFTIESHAAYGMEPRFSQVKELGAWFLREFPRMAALVYHRILMPIALRTVQPPLVLLPGFAPGPAVDEVLLVCRRR